MAERSTVNADVAGSTPALGAIPPDIARRNPCPQCAGLPSLVALGVVYPTLIGTDPGNRSVLVCWACWMGKPLAGAWQAVDQKRHERTWKSERRKQKRKDSEWA